MSDPDVDEIVRHAISASLDFHDRDRLDVAVRSIHQALGRAGYAIRRSEEEQRSMRPDPKTVGRIARVICRETEGGPCECEFVNGCGASLEAAHAVISELQDIFPKWRSIDSAPKDGQEILIGWFDLPGQRSMHVAFFHSMHKTWCQSHHLFTRDPNLQPTHWMPLPPPPGSDEEQEAMMPVYAMKEVK